MTKMIKSFKIKTFNSLNKKNQRLGFTLIEVLVVVAIIGILASIVVVNLTGKTDDAKRAAARATIEQLETALKMFYQDNGFYPTTDQGLQALIEKPTTGRIPQNFPQTGYLSKKKIPKDPWDRDYIYISPGIKNPQFVDIASFGADGEPGGENADADITNY